MGEILEKYWKAALNNDHESMHYYNICKNVILESCVAFQHDILAMQEEVHNTNHSRLHEGSWIYTFLTLEDALRRLIISSTSNTIYQLYSLPILLQIDSLFQ